jgi:hypothetical protein
MMGLKEFFTIKMVYFRPYPHEPKALPYGLEAEPEASIPFRWHKEVAIKRLLISYSCRNSETFNYPIKP